MKNVSRFFLSRVILALTGILMIPLLIMGCAELGPVSRKPPPKKHQYTSNKAQITKQFKSEPLFSSLKESKSRSSDASPPELYASLPPIGRESGPLISQKWAPGVLDFKVVRNRKVEKYIDYFQNQRKGTFRKWLERYGRYGPMMRGILRESGLPEDLVYISLVESGLSPYAYSKARAAGPWQFISSTGKNYGLTINWWIDERRDPVKSTRAAAAYLKDLYGMFGSWPLAMAGYNAGEYRVANAIKRVGSTDFWRIAKTRYIKRETREYVPKIMAVTIIARNPAKYGFTNIDYQSPLVFDEVEINNPTNMKLIALSAGTTYTKIKKLNPELKRGVTPPNYPAYHIKIPSGSGGRFMANLKKVAPTKRTGWQKHQVRRGETLSVIARRYGSSMDAIAELNKLDNPHRIRVGDKLLIPVEGRAGAKRTLASTDGGSNKSMDGVETFRYIIRPGDTITDISREFGISIEDLARLNNLRDPHLIYAGKMIRLPLKGNLVLAGALGGTSPAQNDLKKKKRVEFVNHKVRRGETLSGIALRYGIDTKKIAKWNGLRNVNSLRLGQNIRIPLTLSNGSEPAAEGGESEGGIVVYKGRKYRKVSHSVRRGDSLWEIARVNEVALKDLRRWNRLIKGQHIFPGDVLQVLIALD